MKRNHSWAVAVIAAAFMACSQNELPESSPNLYKPYSGQMETVDSRVTLDDEYMPHWEMGDQLSIFPESDVNHLYKVVQINGSNASFEYVSADEQEGNAIDAHYAVYPYHSLNAVSDRVITTQFPAEIEYSGKENSISHALMTAVSADEHFSFTNAMGVLRLRLNAKQPFMIGNVQSIQLISKTKGLCGTATIDYSAAQQPPSAVIEAAEDNRTLTVNLVKNLQVQLLKSGTEDYSEFYIPMAPEVFEENDLLLVIQGSAKKYSKYVSCEVRIERKKIFTLTHTISGMNYDGDLEGV